MDRIIQSPGKYIQGAGAIKRLGDYLKPLAERWLVVGDKFVLGFAEEMLRKSLADAGLAAEIAPFGGECSHNEINRLRDIAGNAKCTAVLGIGGGKTLDTAKALAHFMNVPVAIAPTIASTDAPCSALSVIYTDEGEFDSYLMLPRNPNMVIVDTQIVAGAPARLLAAGIGDALATWFEARACSRSGATTMAGGKCTQAALALAELCYNTLLEEGEKAMLAAEQHVVTPALERVVEANTYLSGVGFESGGLAAAHAIHNGMTAIPDAHHYYHGEKVAFGTLTQLVLENAPVDEIEPVAALCHSVGLPITLAQLDIKGDIPTKMRLVAEAACAEGETIHNMPGGVDSDQVYAALLVADEFPDVDCGRVVRMCLVHDLGEAFTGDIPAFEKRRQDETHEAALLARWVETLPEPLRAEWRSLYAEMEALATPEARLYKALDILEAVIQHNEADIATWLPLEYDLNIAYGADEVAWNGYLRRLKEAANEISRQKIAEARRQAPDDAGK